MVIIMINFLLFLSSKIVVMIIVVMFLLVINATLTVWFESSTMPDAITDA